MAAAGERIGSYEVVRLIARGGMATVYEARQPALGRAVALKRLDLRVDEPMLLERFIRESRLAATFDHPNIVTVFDFFECDGVPYIAMEYLPRGSLRSVIGHLRSAQVFGVLEGMLAALGHAEAHGVAHRDLKPENVLITHGGAGQDRRLRDRQDVRAGDEPADGGRRRDRDARLHGARAGDVRGGGSLRPTSTRSA